MTPIAGIAAAVFALSRVLSSARRRAEAAPPKGLSGWRIVWGTVGASVCFASFHASAITGVLLAPVYGTWFAMAWPELFLDATLVRWGWARSAWLIERLSGGSIFQFEAPTSWALPFARAHVRRPTSRKRAFLERRLARHHELPTSGAAALALVALQRGEREVARDVFEALAAMPPGELPGPVRRLALDVLALDALANLQLMAAARITEAAGTGPLARLVAKLLPSSGRSRLGACWAWLRAPARMHTRALVRRALARPHTRSAPPVRAGFDAYLALLARPAGAIDGEDLRAAVRSLDALRAEPEFRQACDARAAELGIDAEAAIAAAFGEAESTLARLMLDERMPLHWLPTGATAEALKQRVRDERFATLQSLTDVLERRLEERRDFAPFEEWRAWSALRRASDDAARASPGDDRLVFEIIYGPLTSYVVRLVNVRSQRVMARAVMRYLYALAHATQADYAYELLDKNLSATAHDRLPVRKLDDVALYSDGQVKRWRARLHAALWGVWILVAPPIYWRLSNATHHDDSPWTTILLMAGFGCLVVGLGKLSNLWVDVWVEDDELVIQNKRGRHVICAGDVATVHAMRSGRAWVKLKRKALWLPRWVVTSGDGALAQAFERRK